MKRWIQLAARAVATIVLLSFVWKNAHWSVSLSLTLVMISIELSNQNRLTIIKVLRKEERRDNEAL